MNLTKLRWLLFEEESSRRLKNPLKRDACMLLFLSWFMFPSFGILIQMLVLVVSLRFLLLSFCISPITMYKDSLPSLLAFVDSMY